MSSIMKGIVDENENVAVIYIDGKAAAKYAKKHEAERDAEFMREKFPNKKIEIKQEVREEVILDENLRKWFKEKWVRFGPDGKIRGSCARGDDSEGKPKCLPQKKAHALGKKGRKYAASKKRREDPNPERRGKAKNVATKKKTNEEKCPHCGGELVSEELMNEKKDACYRKVKARYKVWPSAYASGALVQCRKKGASNWGTGGKKNESSIMKGLVDEASGTPGGIEMFRTKDMVNTTMQQNLYRKELQKVKDAEKKRKDAEYRKNNPKDPTLHIGAGAYPIPAIQDWADNHNVEAAINFVVKKFANKQSDEFKTELASDSKFKEAAINLLNVGADILAARNAAMAKRGGTVPDADYRTKEQTQSGYDAVNRVNDVLLGYMKKFGVDKTGRRVPPGFNYTLGEGVIVGHDAKDPEVAIIGGAGTMSLSRLKKKAKAEADLLANDLAKGAFKAAAYNIKQLENTLATIKTAEAEMEKLYFGEDYTGEFAAEKTPAINPYGGQKDRQFRGAISETPTDNPTGASGEGGWRTYKPKSAGTVEEDTAYATGMGQGGNAGQSYRKFKPKSAGTFNEDELDEACWKGYHKEGNKKMFGKTYPNCVKNTNEEELDEGWKMGTVGVMLGTILGHIGLPPGADGIAQLAGMIAGGYFGKDINSVQDFINRFTKNPKEFKQLVAKRKQEQKIKKKAEHKAKLAQGILQVKKIIEAIKNNHFNKAAKMYENSLIPQPSFDLAPLISVTVGEVLDGKNENLDMEIFKLCVAMKNTYKDFLQFPNEYASDFIEELSKLLVLLQKVESYSTRGIDINEEQLDEKCWDSHKQVGMKKKGDKMVPNCVPKESAIMKGLKR